jgi:probable HAF family extracellular repeat protein
MKVETLACWTGLILAGALAAGIRAGAQNQAPEDPLPHYVVINLGNPNGGTSSTGNTINNLGWVMGQANLVGDLTTHAELWLYGLEKDLGTLGGPNSAVIFPNLNDHGQIAGIAETAALQPLGEAWSCGLAFFPTVTGHVCLGFSWQNGQMTKLPTLGGANGVAAANNNLGQIVGWAETTYHDPTCVPPQVLQFEAVVWGPKRGQVQVLPPEPGDSDTAATAVNNKGQVVGISGTCDMAVGAYSAKHAALWENGQPIDLGSLGGHGWNTPTAINNNGQIVGFANFPPDVIDGQLQLNFHAFLWTKETGMADLGTLPGDALSEALGINDQGQVVGVSFGTAQFGEPHAFIWQDGKMTNLNNQIPSDSTLSLLIAQGINDQGVIAGQAFDSSTNTAPAFLALPASPDADPSQWSDGALRADAVLPAAVRQQLVRRASWGYIGH